MTLMSRPATGRRDKLARQLEKLERRREKLNGQMAEADTAWRNALEADEDTAPATSKRRALALDLEDVDAEFERVAGWIAEHDEAVRAAAEAERAARERAEGLARLETGTARLKELQRTEDTVLAAALTAVRTAAERYTAHVLERFELQESLPVQAEALGVPFLGPEPSVKAAAPPIVEFTRSRIAFATQRSVGDVAVEMAAAVGEGVERT